MRFPLRCSLLLISFLFACGGSKNSSDADGGATDLADAGGAGADGASSSANCGNGVLEVGETCDDANLISGDGCSDECQAEDNFACPGAGVPCIQIVTCGNGFIEGDETCDDRNTTAGDGCSEECQVEAGWTCPLAGAACRAAACGDGIIAGFEICDDGNVDPDDGCDQNCKLENGYHCPTLDAPCVETVCGDGLVQGTEECDDQNDIVGDGCTPLCTREPQCSGGTCLAVCGDGFRFDPEECDDGNNINGDGCSADCLIETGFTCEEVPLPDPPEVLLPATIRDFVASCGTGARLPDTSVGAIAPFGHPDFECFNGGLQTGMVEATLDSDSKPVRVANAQTASDASFAQWYRSDNDYNRTLSTVYTLPSIGSGGYQVDFASLYPATGLGFDAEQCNSSPCEQLHVDGNNAGDVNFHFTSEVRWWFEFAGDEVLAFSGDDDVWVFIDGKLAVDIGGVHGRVDRSVDLSDADTIASLGLVTGNIYEAVVFHAERHTTRSQYRLTLTNFTQAPSACVDECGDGVISSQEVCDDGANNGAGSGYGGCAGDCTLEPYCGDGVVNAEFGETCDDGLNLGGTISSCAPGCQSEGATCGDGVTQTSAGESCDDGNTEDGDGCSANCQIEID